jgi:hypothetical protein
MNRTLFAFVASIFLLVTIGCGSGGDDGSSPAAPEATQEDRWLAVSEKLTEHHVAIGTNTEDIQACRQAIVRLGEGVSAEPPLSTPIDEFTDRPLSVSPPSITTISPASVVLSPHLPAKAIISSSPSLLAPSTTSTASSGLDPEFQRLMLSMPKHVRRLDGRIDGLETKQATLEAKVDNGYEKLDARLKRLEETKEFHEGPLEPIPAEPRK